MLGVRMHDQAFGPWTCPRECGGWSAPPPAAFGPKLKSRRRGWEWGGGRLLPPLSITSLWDLAVAFRRALPFFPPTSQFCEDKNKKYSILRRGMQLSQENIAAFLFSKQPKHSQLLCHFQVFLAVTRNAWIGQVTLAFLCKTEKKTSQNLALFLLESKLDCFAICSCISSWCRLREFLRGGGLKKKKKKINGDNDDECSHERGT